MKQENDLIFPKGFLWGAATSSHQVEGGTFNDWSEWEVSELRIRNLESRRLIKKLGRENFISGRGADHYHFYKEDFKLAKELGHNATRFSIEWSRVEPKEGVFDEVELEHYKQAVRTLRDLNIEPFVTLWHWTIPLWLRDKGGWQSKEIIRYFSRYCEKVVAYLGPDVKFWITLNEPEVYAGKSYLQGDWPPQKHNPWSYYKVTKNLITAHNQAYAAIKKINTKAQVGLVTQNAWFEAYKNRLVNRALKRLMDWWWNDYVLTHTIGKMDFIGLNNYFHNRINYGFNKNENKITSDLGWELYPEAIYRTLVDLKKYKKPIYITENGLADAGDRHRAWFIIENLKNVHRAIADGVDIRGYLHWSLMDNFEWAEGFWPRFGLIEIDYKTLKRTPRPSAYLYRDIIKANGFANRQ